MDNNNNTKLMIPDITRIVSTYEEVIEKNREQGFDRDILGNKSTLPSPFRPERTRRFSECFHLFLGNSYHAQDEKERNGKIKNFPKLRRRMTLLDAMSSSSLLARSTTINHDDNSTENPEEATHRTVGSALKSFKMTKMTDTDRSSLTKECRIEPSTFTKEPEPPQSVTMPPQKAPQQPKEKSPMVPDEDDHDNDPEIQALQQQIAVLQNKLQKVQQDEQNQLATVEKQKQQRIAKFNEKQYQKLGLTTSIAYQVSVARCYYPTRQILSEKAARQQYLIDQLRHSNKKLRSNLTQLAAKIQAAKQEQIALLSDSFTTYKYYDKLCGYHSSEQNVHQHVTTVIPKYQHKVEEFDKEAAYRAECIDFEKRIKSRYDKCLERIVVAVETRCCDADLVDQVVTMSLGLEMSSE